MSTSIIICGKESYTKENFDRFIFEGLNPVCFANIVEKKQYKTSFGLEILKLDEAIKRYPDYELYLMLDSEYSNDASMYLRDKGIPEGRIKYIDSYECRWGCDLLDRELRIYGDCIASSCGKNKIPYVMDNLKAGWEKYEVFRSGLFDLHKSGNAGRCKGCANFSEKLRLIKPHLEINTLAFNGGFNGDICNLKCSYCCQDYALKNLTAASLKMALIQAIDIFGKSKCLEIRLLNGEFFIRKDADEILDYLLDKDCKIVIATNATVYNELFIKLIRRGKVNYINVSLDSGTRETYKKIKKYDFFEKVVGNLEKYSREGLHIKLKYIFLPEINDNEKDIGGFIEIARRLNAKVEISSDTNKSRASLPKQTMDAAIMLCDKAARYGLNVSFHAFYFSDKDISVLNQHCKNII